MGSLLRNREWEGFRFVEPTSLHHPHQPQHRRLGRLPGAYQWRPGEAGGMQAAKGVRNGQHPGLAAGAPMQWRKAPPGWW